MYKVKWYDDKRMSERYVNVKYSMRMNFKVYKIDFTAFFENFENYYTLTWMNNWFTSIFILIDFIIIWLYLLMF